MTQEEILEYNKKCAEFLGVRPQHFGPSVEYEMYSVIESIVDGPDEKHFFMVEEMLFHSDWNWIMVMVEGIEKTKTHFIIRTLWNEFNECNYTQVSVQKEVGEMSDDRKVISNSIDVYLKHSDTFKSKKRAVVQAINNFLIWYNLQKKEL
jgi:hypothetical protein